MLFDGVTFENFSRCTSADHTECLQVEAGRQRHDPQLGLPPLRHDGDPTSPTTSPATPESAAGYGASDNILIENNFIDEALDNSGGPTYFGLNMRECTNCTIRYNSWLQEPRMPNGEISLNNKFIGNLGPMSDYNCYTNGVTYSHNV